MILMTFISIALLIQEMYKIESIQKHKMNTTALVMGCSKDHLLGLFGHINTNVLLLFFLMSDDTQ